MTALIKALIPLLIQIESGGDHLAIGDNGRAVGLLQIHKCVVDDVNQFYNTNYTYNDRYDPVSSKEMALLYLSYWGDRYTKKTSKEPTIEILVKCWNGGPNGYMKKSTEAYWEKFLRAREGE